MTTNKFWATQPVAAGPGDAPVQPSAPPAPAPTLPHGLRFRTVDISTELGDVHALLNSHYVEDDCSAFRLAYSKDFLLWQFCVPGADAGWNLGLFATGGAREALVGYISACPMPVTVNGRTFPSVLGNFLCIDRSYRRQRLAPLLIAELARRANACGIYQAVFTAGERYPFKHSESRYHHRIINVCRLVDAGFCSPRELLHAHRYGTEDARRSGVRDMRASDLPRVHALYARKYGRYRLHCSMDAALLGHFILPRRGVVHSIVREGAGGEVADFATFFMLGSRALRGAGAGIEVRGAYLYYYHSSEPGGGIVGDAIAEAKAMGCDVFNCLDIEENPALFDAHGFTEGDGLLHYYLFNWKTQAIAREENGLVSF